MTLVAEYAYIDVAHAGSSATGKTQVWRIFTKPERGRVLLGQISWFGRWRQYVFFPGRDTVYSRGCLSDIADFIARQS